MKYSVKEIYYTIQGEGAHTGRPAVFCRFSGCNLWSGLEKDRSSAICFFCDTDFVGTDGPGGAVYSSENELANYIKTLFPSTENRFVVFTGGEPLLQLDQSLVDALHRLNIMIAVETNGTLEAPASIDWICVSPKANAPLKLSHGNELKLVYPQEALDPSRFINMNFEHFFLQPMDGDKRDKNTKSAIEYCKKNPQWKLSLQTHKYLGIP